MRDLRRTLGLPQGPRRGRIGPRALGVGTVVLVVVVAAVLAGRMGAPTVPRASASGATDRITFHSIRIGSAQLDVRRLLGEPPRRIMPRVIGGEARQCWKYARRSGRAGGYRFCFADGRLVSKDRLPQTPS